MISAGPAPAGPVLAVIGDIHAQTERLERVLDRIDQVGADAVLMVGDLACCGHETRRSAQTLHRYRGQVARVLDQVRSRGRPFCFVPGNHDLAHLEDPANVDGRVVQVAGLRIAGVGGAGPDIFGFAYEWGEDEIRSRPTLQADVWVSHAPPRRTAIDLTHGGLHVGSEAVRELALRTHGVMVCGHIHEAPGMARLGDCMCLNAGALGAPFGRTQVGFVYGLDRLVYEDLDRGTRQEWLRDGADTLLPR